MEIKEFAERIVFGKSIEDKLLSFNGQLIEANYSPLSDIPAEPGREQHWRPNFIRQGKFDFPKVGQLVHNEYRAKALHFFANHELEAIELMALMLLRFPDAPKTYRKSLLAIIKEEQTHLNLYISRMRDLGVNFGDYPLSGFFWKELAKARDLKEFTVLMSLTLEQANLDHCLYYEKIFRQVGDSVTADIMQRVFKDEVGHVRHGLNWFNQWRDQNLSQWQAFTTMLPASSNPARAKGKIFCRSIRESLGFDADFIENLETYSQSKGRVPDLYYFYPYVEWQLANGPNGINVPKHLRSLKEDLQTLPLFFAKKDDCLLVEKKPSLPFLQTLKNAGFSIPEFVTLEQPLHLRRIREFRPWGWCYSVDKLFSDLRSRFSSDSFGNQKSGSRWYETVYQKNFSADLLRRYLQKNKSTLLASSEIVGDVCTSTPEVGVSLKKFLDLGYEDMVIKAPFGSSGQNQIRIVRDISASQKVWLARLLQQQGRVVVEPWLKKEFDFSIQIEVTPVDKKVLGLARFLTDETGKYKGALLGGFDVLLSEEQKKIIHNGEDSFTDFVQETAEFVASALREFSYSGVAGIDGFVFRDKNGALKIKPIVEINCRWNMGTLTTIFSRHLNSRRVGVWRIFHKNEIIKAGFKSLEDFVDKMTAEFPLQMDANSRLISRGILCTNDPKEARELISVMHVTESEQELRVSPLQNIF